MTTPTTSIPRSINDYRAELGARILAARLRADLTQDEVAARIGVSQQGFAKWEAGVSAPRARRMDALIAVLGPLDGEAAKPIIASTTALAERIHTARVHSGISRAALALAVGVSVAAIGHWEAGTNEPRGHHLQALCEALDIKPVDRLDIAAASSMPRSAVPTTAIPHELLMAELVIVTMHSMLTSEQRQTLAGQLDAIGVSGSTPTRSAERRAAITAAGAA